MWVALHRRFLPSDPTSTMQRESCISTIREHHGKTNTELITRNYEHLLVLEYTGNPPEIRRIFYFLVQARRDDNHRQNAAIQYITQQLPASRILLTTKW